MYQAIKSLSFLFKKQTWFTLYFSYKTMWWPHRACVLCTECGSLQDGQRTPDRESWWTWSPSRGRGWDSSRSWRRHQRRPWQSRPGWQGSPCLKCSSPRYHPWAAASWVHCSGEGDEATSTEPQWPVTLQGWGLPLLFPQEPCCIRTARRLVSIMAALIAVAIPLEPLIPRPTCPL